MIQRLKVQGEDVRLIVLPRPTRKAKEAWDRFVASETIFGLDIEATAFGVLGPFDPSIKTRLIQFGTYTEAWVLNVDDPRWRKVIASFLADEGKRFVSHNAGFDGTRVRFEFGIDLGDRSIDTLPMAALRWPGITRPKDLKSLSTALIDGLLADADKRLHARFCDLYYANKPRKTRLLPLNFEPGVSTCRQPKQKGKEKCTEPSWVGSLCGYCEAHYMARKVNKAVEEWGWNNIELDDPVYTEYAGLDAIYVRRLLDILAAEIKNRGMGSLSRTEQRVKRYMTDVSFKGHRVDREWTASVLDEVEAEFNVAADRVEELTGFVARSPKIKDWFWDHDIRVKSLDKDHLPDLVDLYGDEPLIGEVLTNLQVVSKHSNLLANLRTIMLHATEGDGYVHPNINTLQAHTGRMSITGPAMQTLAKKGEKGTRLRGCFIARDGHVLIGADYDSQEIRLAAALSRDAALLRIVAEGLNQHVLTAESLFANWVDKESNPNEYGAAKILDFAQQYGAMPRKIAATLNKAGIPTTEAEAYKLWQRWRETYAGLVRWSDEQGKKRYVRNPFGRVIPRDPFRDYANGNYLIQSSGRDVLGEAMCRLADHGWAPSFWLPIHDELVMEVEEDRVDAGVAALTEHMTTTVKGILIPAEGEVVGTRWRGLG